MLNIKQSNQLKKRILHRDIFHNIGKKIVNKLNKSSVLDLKTFRGTNLDKNNYIPVNEEIRNKNSYNILTNRREYIEQNMYENKCNVDIEKLEMPPINKQTKNNKADS